MFLFRHVYRNIKLVSKSSCILDQNETVIIIELTCRTANIARAEEIEMRVFGSHNPVRQPAGRGHEGTQQNVEREQHGTAPTMKRVGNTKLISNSSTTTRS